MNCNGQPVPFCSDECDCALSESLVIQMPGSVPEYVTLYRHESGRYLGSVDDFRMPIDKFAADFVPEHPQLRYVVPILRQWKKEGLS